MGPSKTGFSDVDASGKSEELADYLTFLGDRLDGVRRQGLQMLRLPAAAAVLDVGCGAGEVCRSLARLVGPFGCVVGVDLSVGLIARARSECASSGPHVSFGVANAYRLPFPDQSFDLVRAERVFQHLDDPESALTEMVRVTRIGGRVMLIDAEHGQTSVALDDPLDRRVFEAWRRSILTKVANPHSGVRLRGLLQRAGLAEVKHLTTPVEMAYPDFRRATELDDILEGAVRTGSTTREEVDALLSSLQARHRAGTFLATGLIYSVIGSRPG